MNEDKTLKDLIKIYLDADITLASYLTGGIHARMIVRPQRDQAGNPVAGSTPAAFEGTEPFRVKPNLSMGRVSESANTGGPHGAMWAFPELYFRCQPKDTEKAKVNQAWLRCYDLLHFKNLAMPGGTGIKMSVIGGTEFDDDLAIQNCVVRSMRLQGDGLWRLVL